MAKNVKEHSGDHRESASEPRSSAPIAAIVTPVLAFGATYFARKALTSAYRGITGSEAPSNKDREVSLTRIVAWAAVTGATAAVIEALIFRSTATFFDE